VSQQINLFNPILLKQRKVFSTATMLQALALIALGMIAMSAFSAYRLKSMQGELQVVANQRNSLEADLVKLKGASNKSRRSAALEEDLKRAETRSNALQQALNMLKNGEAGDSHEYSEYFAALARQIVDGLWLTRVEIVGAGNSVSLGGRTMRAELLPAFVSRLSKEPAMQGKTFSTLEMSVPKSQEERTGEAKKVGSAPAGYIEFELRSERTALSNSKDGGGDVR
jgi:Tfp pilus assembly protein PilN